MKTCFETSFVVCAHAPVLPLRMLNHPCSRDCFRNTRPLKNTELLQSAITAKVSLPLQLFKGTHHRSEFHGERVCFSKVCMSAILEKRVRFWPRYSQFLEKGVYFLHIQQSPPQNSAFCRKKVTFESSKVLSTL